MPPMDATSSSSSDITTLHPDIIRSHILNRLDGPTLASASSSTLHLRRLCSDHNLWRTICAATWPSLNQPHASALIDTFPAAHRSVFSDSFPSIQYSPPPNPIPPRLSPEFVSAVDLYYKGRPVFSRVITTETHKGWFLSSPLWVDLLDPNEVVPTPLIFAKCDEESSWLAHLEENLGLSWIVIDPTRKRAANLSSRRPVAARRHWLTGDLEVIFAVTMETVQWVIRVTCCGKAGGAMHVREASLTMEDTEGRHVTGRDSFVILQDAVENGERRKPDPEEAKARFDKFCRLKREIRERKLRRDSAMDTVAMLVSFTIFVSLFWFMVFGF
ncbi:F-box protein At2g27310 [Vigna radiata var. radiata]|uniref:F-box protein At2g27310 n=1 Tax=Vigna radiata var. radiata TaxID=3916 RepID=A0A1S3VWU4_VIGRR|nr:F-box protein At2g27310 [Vigna radiata var. radiata]